MYFLVSKSDAYLELRDFLSDVLTDGKLHIVRSNNGGEFGSHFLELCSEHLIRQEFTLPDRPQYNGIAERAIALIEKTDGSPTPYEGTALTVVRSFALGC